MNPTLPSKIECRVNSSNRELLSFMEKIITVKQEPIDDAYPTPPSTTVTATSTTSTTTTTQNVTTKVTTVTTLATGTATTVATTAIAASPETQIFFIQQPKPEVQKPQCTGTGTQGWCRIFNDWPVFNNVILRCWQVGLYFHFDPCPGNIDS